MGNKGGRRTILFFSAVVAAIILRSIPVNAESVLL